MGKPELEKVREIQAETENVAALPIELRPQVEGPGGFEPPTSRLEDGRTRVLRFAHLLQLSGLP